VLPVAEQPLPVTGIWGAFGLCVLLVLYQLAFAIVVGIVGFATGLIRVPEVLYAAATVIALLSFIAVARRADGGAVRRAVAIRGCHPTQFVLAVLLAPPLMPLCGVAAELVVSALGWDSPAWEPEAVLAARPALFDRFDRFYEQLARLPWIWALLFGSVGPAVGEELFFRGVIGRRLVARYGPILGVLLTSALFGLAHVEPSHVAATFVAGLALHGVYLATRSLLAPIALHATYNAVWIATAKWAESCGLSLAEVFNWTTSLAWLVMAGGATVAALAWIIYRTRTLWVMPDGTEWSPGHLSAEMPPTSVAAVPVVSRPGSVAPVLAGVVYFCFALTVPLVGLGSAEVARARQRGDELLRSGDAAGAISAYTDALVLAPDDRYLLGNRGLAYVARQEFTAAIADFDRALAFGPPEIAWLNNRAYAHHCLGQIDAAWGDYEAVVHLRPDDAYARQQRGTILSARNDWAGAVSEFDRALQSGEDSADLRADLGRALTRRYQFARAIRELSEAIRQEPDHLRAAYELAWLRATCPDPALRNGRQAVELARSLCDRAPRREPAYLAALAAAEAECGQFPEAIRAEEEALRLAPDAEREFHAGLLALFRAGRPFRIDAGD